MVALRASMSGSPLGGMTQIHLLMNAFHLVPWPRLFTGH
jgi:hypothetical protein